MPINETNQRQMNERKRNRSLLTYAWHMHTWEPPAMNNQRVVGMWAYEAKGQKRSQGLLGGRDELTEGHKEK